MRFGFAHHASRSLRPTPTQVKHLCLGAVGLTAVHRKRKRKQHCGNRVVVSPSRTAVREPEDGVADDTAGFTAPRYLAENGKCAMQRPKRRNR